MFKPYCIRRALVLVLMLFCLRAFSQAPRNLDVIDLEANTSPSQRVEAWESFMSGGAILRARGGRQEAAEDLLGIPHMHAAALINAEPSSFLGAAAYKDEHGTVRLVEAFGSNSNANNAAGMNPLDRWVQREQARMARAADSGDPAPPAEAWTALYRGTIYGTSAGGDSQLTVGVYRLNSINKTYDYYMVATTPQTTPSYEGGPCNLGYCDWHLLDRETYMSASVTTPAATGTVIDHGPTTTIGSTETGFSIGASLSPEAPGVDVAFSSSWSTPDITTTDKSTDTQAEWDEKVTLGPFPCNPAGGAPIVSTSTYLSRQAAIFQVPAGTTDLTLPVKFHSDFCFYDSDSVPAQYGVHSTTDLTFGLPLGPPALQAYPSALTISAGATGNISVSATIPGSAEGFSWTSVSDQLWATVDSSGPFSVSRLLPIAIAKDTPNGSIAHISINSDPKYASPSVRSGPLEVVVTVGPGGHKPIGGVLLSGGQGTNFTGPTATPNSQVYDYTTNTVGNTGPPSVPRAFHTATMLKDGRVLVVGGRTASGENPVIDPVTAVAEIYDPATLGYSATGSLQTGRQQHTATRLPDGKVLITGGTGGEQGPLASAELYDPVTGQFSPAGTMITSRYGHTASLIVEDKQPAKVFIYGGMTTHQQALSTTEVWDESTGKFTAGSSAPSTIQYNPQPEPLQNGDLVIAGAILGGKTSTQELLIDPKQPPALLTSNAQLNHARAYGALAPLASNGELLITGGASEVGPQNYLNDAEVRNATGWTEVTAHMLSARIFHTSTLLPNGKVFIAGGLNDANDAVSTTELYDPAARTFAAGPTMNARFGQTATLFSTSITTVSAAPSLSIAGQSVMMSAQVETASGSSSGSVEFYDGTISLGSATVTDGQASISYREFPVGSHSLTAVYSGDASNGGSTSDPVTLMVTAAGTSTSLSSSLNPSSEGQKVTFSASVQAQTGAGKTPTGEITFKDGDKDLASMVLKDAAASYTQALSLGTHLITAKYSGDSTHSPSVSGVVPQVVNPPGTLTTLAFMPSAPTYGQTVTFTSAVVYQNRALPPENGTPAGIVEFKEGDTTFGQATLDNGTAVFKTMSLPAGLHGITATYTGSSDAHGSTSASQSINVARATSATRVESSLNPSNPGQAVTFTAHVTSSGGIPTGHVTFSDGAMPIGDERGVLLVGGSATVSTAALTPGTHPISAAYTGDNNFTSSASDAILQIVSPSKTTTALSVSPRSSVFSQTITLTGTVSGSAGTRPTGSVTFNDKNMLLGQASLVNGTAILAIPSPHAGELSITATYTGDSANAESTSPAIVVNVSQAPTTIILTSSPNPSLYRQAVVLKAAVSSTQKGALTGKVDFRDGTDSLDTVAVANGVATLNTSHLPVGRHRLTATYEADPNFQQSTSAVVDQVVNPAAVATTTTLSATPSDGSTETLITFNIEVRAASGTKVPDGTVTLNDGASPIETLKLSGGTAHFSKKFDAGQHPITAVYNENADFAGSSSPVFMVTINALITPEVVMVSDPNPSKDGQLVDFTVTVSSKGNPTPTGSVNVSEDLPDGKTIYYGSTHLVNGVGVVATTKVPVGRHSITATYGGDDHVRYNGAASKPLVQVVNQP